MESANLNNGQSRHRQLQEQVWPHLKGGQHKTWRQRVDNVHQPKRKAECTASKSSLFMSLLMSNSPYRIIESSSLGVSTGSLGFRHRLAAWNISAHRPAWGKHAGNLKMRTDGCMSSCVRVHFSGMPGITTPGNWPYPCTSASWR